jgi:hypothetical protein
VEEEPEEDPELTGQDDIVDQTEIAADETEITSDETEPEIIQAEDEPGSEEDQDGFPKEPGKQIRIEFD